MFHTTSGMSINVAGGSAEENSQLCTVVAAALNAHGFRNVQLQPSSEYVTNTYHDLDTIAAMRNLNPDLFDTRIIVGGESEEDMRTELNAMGLGHQPFAFQVERVYTF